MTSTDLTRRTYSGGVLPPEVRAARARRWGWWYFAEHQFLNVRRYGWPIIFYDIGQPLVYLAAMGLGLGAIVDANAGAIDGVPYRSFVGPALLVSMAMMTLLLANPVNIPATLDDATPGRFAIRPVLIYLAGYFLFGAGYIAYMTFMIAFVRDAGGSAAAQSAFWCLIGLSAFASPWVWRGVLARGQSGTSTAIILGFNAIGAALPLFSQSAAMLALSAVVFGVAFFAVVTATTAFIRFNYPATLWPSAIAAMTVAFGIGQTLGPIATGYITDATGSLSAGLGVSAAALAIGAVATAFQRRLAKATV